MKTENEIKELIEYYKKRYKNIRNNVFLSDYERIDKLENILENFISDIENKIN